MHGKQEKSKHGGNGHNDPTYGQWHTSTQAAYSPDSTPRTSPLTPDSHFGGAGSMNDVGFHDSDYPDTAYQDANYHNASYYSTTGYDYQSSAQTYTHASPFGGGQAGHMPANIQMPSYGQNSGENAYSNTEGSWSEDPSQGLTGTPQQHGYQTKGKEVAYDGVSAPHSNSVFHNQDYTEHASPSAGPTNRTGGVQGSGYPGFYPNAGFGSGSVEDHGNYEEEDDGEEDVDDAEEDYDSQDLELAIEESRRAAYYGDNQEAGPSASSESAYAPTGYDDMGMAQTPRLEPSVAGLSGAMGSLNLADQVGGDSSMGVDPGSFGVVNSYQYQPGRVFKMFWSEPRGKQGNGRTTALPTGLPTENWNHDKNFYVGVRRFVIIATDRSHHSTCVPILTYEHRACTKPGVQPGTHGIIYSLGRQPTLLKGERDLGYRPVSCEMSPHESLVKESRVNYSKLTTIEHNVEVQFIGNITASDFEIVQHAVDDCWQKKKRHSTREAKPKPGKPSKPRSSKTSRPKSEVETKHKPSSSKTSSDRKHPRR